MFTTAALLMISRFDFHQVDVCAVAQTGPGSYVTYVARLSTDQCASRS